MSNSVMQHLWQAKDYCYHSSVQSNAANSLLEQLPLTGHEHILDVGCGDGKISARITKNVTDGHVTGIDISPQMIGFAREMFPANQHSNLTFLIQDAQQFNYHEQLDVIFSSFALQWLPNPDLFFKSAYQSLKCGGRIAATIPLGISVGLTKAIEEILSCPDWVGFFQDFSPEWHFIESRKYKCLLIANNFRLTHFTEIDQSVVFPSRQEFEKYVMQWFSYLNHLPQHLRPIFFEQVIDKYLKTNHLLPGGNVNFQFARLDFIAEKD